MPPISKAFIFMAVSIASRRRCPLLAHIGAAGLHSSFSGMKYFVTKFVRSGGSHNPTHIRKRPQDVLVYIACMQASPHILIVDDHREIRDLVSLEHCPRMDFGSARRRTAKRCARSWPTTGSISFSSISCCRARTDFRSAARFAPSCAKHLHCRQSSLVSGSRRAAARPSAGAP